MGGGDTHIPPLPLLFRFAYAYVMRYFNGEPDSEASEAASFLVEISAVLQVLSRLPSFVFFTTRHDTTNDPTRTDRSSCSRMPSTSLPTLPSMPA
jgi:hypothetical protein